jgi:hypothetical protein
VKPKCWEGRISEPNKKVFVRGVSRKFHYEKHHNWHSSHTEMIKHDTLRNEIWTQNLVWNLYGKWPHGIILKLTLGRSFFLGSTAQLRPWPHPQNPAKFLGGFSTIFFFLQDRVVSPTPNPIPEDQASVFISPRGRVATHFSRLLRHAWVTVGLFLFPGHHTGKP